MTIKEQNSEVKSMIVDEYSEAAKEEQDNSYLNSLIKLSFSDVEFLALLKYVIKSYHNGTFLDNDPILGKNEIISSKDYTYPMPYAYSNMPKYNDIRVVLVCNKNKSVEYLAITRNSGASGFTTQQLENAALGKAAVMNIRQEVREKFVFWRQLRNVSAHYKGYDLNKAHTLALYSFIEQYLMTFSVEGSRESLNEQFDVYFNPTITSVHADLHPLLAKIDGIIQDDEFDVFFTEVRKSCCRHARFTDRFEEFVHQVIDSCSSRVRDAVVKYVQSDYDFRDDYLDKYPEDVLTILAGVNNIHNFWFTRLPFRRKKLVMLALLLEADYIPDADKKESMLKCLHNAEEYVTCTEYGGIKAEFAKVLFDKGFFDLFYNSYFNPENTSRNAQAICYKTDFYVGMIRLIPWDKKFVEQLIAVFSEQYYPYTLQTRMQEMYREDAGYKVTIDKICADEGLILPSVII